MFLKIREAIPVNDSLAVKINNELKDVIRLMVKNKLTWLPVIDNKNHLIGRVDIFSLLDKEKISFYQQQTLASALDTEVNTINLSDQLKTACYYPVERAVIDQEGNIKGVLSKNDIIRAMFKELTGLKFCFEKMSDGIVYINNENQIVFCNGEFVSLTGEKTKKIMGASIDTVAFLHKDLVKEVFEKGETRNTVTRIMGNFFNCSYYPVMFLNNVEWVMGVMSSELSDQTAKYLFIDNTYDDRGNEHEASNSGVVCESQVMKKVFALSKKAASVDATVLISGETGVGKEVIASYIHSQSNRAHNAFIQINCGAIPENLLESELFGYEKGAFTGANREGKRGLFEAAENGTILLDEISEMPMELQVKLLRVLQHGELFRVGSIKPKKIDVRIIATTNKDLRIMIEQGKFREDLYYRLHVIPIQISPLRERLDDIRPLAEYFLRQFNANYFVKKEFSPEIFPYLNNYKWPGNVRELQNLIEQMVIMSETNFVTLEDLPEFIKRNIPRKDKISISIGELISLKEANIILEKSLLTEAVGRSTSIRQAAKSLGVDHSTMLRKLNKYNMSVNSRLKVSH